MWAWLEFPPSPIHPLSNHRLNYETKNNAISEPKPKFISHSLNHQKGSRNSNKYGHTYT